MIIISGTQQLTPEGLETLRGEAAHVLTETRKEDGCIVYSFAEDFLQPGLIRIYEEWKSRETLAQHQKSPHVAAWHAALKTVEVLGRDLKIIEAGREEPLA